MLLSHVSTGNNMILLIFSICWDFFFPFFCVFTAIAFAGLSSNLIGVLSFLNYDNDEILKKNILCCL